MMTKEQLNRILCAVIPTIDEVDYAPESVLYLGTGLSLDDWMIVKSLMVNAGFVKAENDTLVILPLGRIMATKINFAMGKIPQQKAPETERRDRDYDPDTHLGKPMDPSTERRLGGY